MFGIKISCQLCCDLARPVMQQNATNVLRDSCSELTRSMMRL